MENDVLEEIEEMRTYPFGWDFGHAGSGSVLVKGTQVLKLYVPTTFAHVDASKMKALLSDEEESKNGKAKAKGTAKDTPDTSMIIVELKEEGTPFAFGDYALTQKAEPWNGRGDNQRHASKFALRGLLASAGTLIPDKEFGLYVVAGLPADYYIRFPELKKAIKKRLDGEHEFSLDGGKTWRKAHVEVGAVVMEGAGALIAYPGLTKTSEAAVIDIGRYSSDLYAQQGATPITDYCKGKALAVENAIELLRQMFRDAYKRDLTEKEAQEIMYAYADRKKAKDDPTKRAYPAIAAFGSTVKASDLEKMTKKAVGLVAEELVTFVVSVFKDAIARLHPIVDIGGGAYYFHDEIAERIPHVVMHSDPVYANPLGYANLAGRKLLKKMQEERAKAEAEAEAAAAQLAGTQEG